MWRALVLVAALAAPAVAQPITRPSQVDPGKRPQAKATAKKPKVARTHKAKAKAKRAPTSKRKVAATSRVRRVAMVAQPRRITVEQQSVQLASVGRVRYGADQMPPGFAWPPTQDMAAVEQSCETELDTLGVVWKHAEPLGKVTDPIVVPTMVIGGIPYKSAYDQGPYVVDCQLARMLAHVAPKLVALGVREVNFGSIYRNTRVRFGGVRGKALSRHALGFAMDITSFVDKDGHVVAVETDYPKHHALLLAIEDLIDHDKDFRILLTPKNDPISHHDHFHIEASVDFRR